MKQCVSRAFWLVACCAHRQPPQPYRWPWASNSGVPMAAIQAVEVEHPVAPRRGAAVLSKARVVARQRVRHRARGATGKDHDPKAPRAELAGRLHRRFAAFDHVGRHNVRLNRDTLAPSNASLVKTVADLRAEFGRPVASATTARALLGLASV